MRHTFLISTVVFLWCVPSVALADADPFQVMQQQLIEVLDTVNLLSSTVAGLEGKVAGQNEVIQRQAAQINALMEGRTVPQTLAASQSTRAPKTAGLSQGINPDIGLVGTVQAKLTESSDDEEGNDTIVLKELELSISQYVDPYSRLDAVMAMNDNIEPQNIDIEEAYYTHWGLPFGFTGQIGKFRSKAGKQNLMHLHQLLTADYPEVIKEFFGEEGLASSGARLQNWLPNPFDVPVEITTEILRGNNGNVFGGISRRPIFNTHVKSFFEPTDDISVELGGTAMFGDENASGSAGGDDRFGTHIFGGDLTVIYQMLQGRRVTWQSELFAGDGSSNLNINQNPWGFYSLIDVLLSPQWSGGIRFDYVEPLAVTGGHVSTTAVSPYLTFSQSEFARFRLQYTHKEPADPVGKPDNAIFMEANFLIGAHKHPVQ